MTPCMDEYKAKIKSDGSLDKLKLILVVREDLQNKKVIEVTWFTTTSMSNMKYFIEDAYNHKSRVHQLVSLENS